MSSPGAGEAAQTRVRMVAQPASVPAVRRFVDDALTTWGRTDLIDDVSLSVTELATNATLHSHSTYFDVELTSAPEAVRVSVSDGGAASGRAIASQVDRARTGRRDPADPDEASTTGRGLFIVSALASSWGIDDLPDGTRIWADFTGVEGATLAQPVIGGVAVADEPPSDTVSVIRLLGCPPDSLLAHDDNLAEVARELSLFGASHADPEAVESSRRIGEVVTLSALSWNAARLVAQQAAAEGRAAVDIAIAIAEPELVPARVQVLRTAMDAAEQMARDGLLMTMPAAEPVQRWRDWVEVEMTEQASTGRPARPFADFRPAHER